MMATPGTPDCDLLSRGRLTTIVPPEVHWRDGNKDSSDFIRIGAIVNRKNFQNQSKMALGIGHRAFGFAARGSWPRIHRGRLGRCNRDSPVDAVDQVDGGRGDRSGRSGLQPKARSPKPHRLMGTNLGMNCICNRPHHVL